MQALRQEDEWNKLVCNSKFSFEPVIGEIYHLPRDAEGVNIFRRQGRNNGARNTNVLKFNSDEKWIFVQANDSNFY